MINLNDLIDYFARFAVLLFILPAHEFAHAFVAFKFDIGAVHTLLILML